MAPTLVETVDAEPTSDLLRRRFEDLRRQALDAFNQTRFQESWNLFVQALECARSLGDPVLEDLAFCGRTACGLELGRGRDDVPKLRETLMRSGDDETCFLASYILATQVFNREGDYRKALFYSRVARTHAERLGREDWLASCHNEIANALLATSFFDRACEEYQEALDRVPEDALLERALILDNLGYCRVVQNRHKEGFGMLFWSLRTLRRLGLRRYQARPHIGLSFAYIAIGRYRSALRHGFEALRIAEDGQDAEAIKQALYILGEAAKGAGASHAAYRFYQRLQTDYYPGDDSLAQMLLTVDTRDLINLRA